MKKNRCKIQDENMANQIENELTSQFREANGEENYREPVSDHEVRALTELKLRIEDAILANSLLGEPNDDDVSENETAKAIEQLKEIKLWGVPLMPSKHREGTDIVLLKFLRSNHYNVNEAFEKLRKTLVWRKEFKVDEILDESLGPDFEKVGYLNTIDKDGRPLFYNVYGDLKENQMQYHKMLGSEESSERFLRWRVQCIEKYIKELNLEHGGADSVIQVIDWKEFQGPPTKELRSVYRQCLTLIEDHYPEIIHQNIIVNVPLWYYVSHSLYSRLITPTNTKTIFARPEKVTETLLKFVSPENLLVEYGGLKRMNDNEFSSENKTSELNLKPHATTEIEIPALEVGVTIVWDVTVVGWEVTYKEEFVPEDEGSYKILLQEMGRPSQCVRNSYYINEAGKIVISIQNDMNKITKVIYRYKTKPTVPMYLLHKT